ncbi:MAG TPA: glycosyltransferase family 4 protein [Stellaceae bacterium]|nr:glycosyltransferase family 4 protein [Stellaceae bacterium]
MTEIPAFASRTREAAGEDRLHRELVFIAPGRLDQLTGGYLFDRHIVEGLRARDRVVRVVELAARDPRGEEAVLAAVADGTPTVVDGLVLANLGEVVVAHARRLRLIALVHGPLAHETGLSPAAAKRAAQREAALLLRLRGVLCASRKTAATIARYGVSPDRIAIAPPGTAKPHEPPRPRRGPVRALLCVANLVPLKGHSVLVAALAQLCDLEWTLLCIGSLERDPATAEAVRQTIAAAGLERRITLAGERAPAAVAAAYGAADAFVLPSFHEGYGMVYAEAMANGLPVIATIAGAIPETVPPSAGLLVPPGDPAALAQAVRRVIADPRLATRLAAGSREAGARLPDWPRAIADWEAAFDRLVTLPPPS